MKRIILFFIIVTVFCQLAVSQTFTDSNLPIVIITTDGGVDIPDDPRVMANMKIIYRGISERNYVADKNNSLYLNYDGRISIEIRGSSSQDLPKKPYGLTTLKSDNITNNNVSLLGLPAENDWILNSLAFDPSCIRDYLSYNLSRQIGEYATRTVYCEVIINNDYKGLYMLQEKIKADKNRVNVTKIATTDNTLPALSGGYITKADKPNGDPIAWTMYAYNGQPVDYIHDLPKPEAATAIQTTYIKGQFNKLATAANTNDISRATGYPSIIDVPSFINYMLLNELASNPDAYQYSTYFHKDMNGKLRAGPIWDHNLTYGNDLFIYGFDRSKTNVWQFNDNSGNNGSKFWYDLFYNSTFRCYLSRRWNELISEGQPFHPDSINSEINKVILAISEALPREEARWGSIGDHAQEIAGIKTFLSARISWITSYIGSYSGCSNVALPPVVISKIMYNPQTTSGFLKSSDMEFIQISNNGSQNVDLSGVYFSGTGLVYQFPINTIMNANSSIMLAADATVFQNRYGLVPFGQFTRSLSDSGQKIELSDAFGNIIDVVFYSDSDPWPNADGNGYYLDLMDLSSDNTLAESWKLSSDISASVDGTEEGIKMSFSPNPVRFVLTIESQYEIQSLKMFDMSGNVILSENVGCEKTDIDMSLYKPGVYLFKVQTSAGVITQKIVKY